MKDIYIEREKFVNLRKKKKKKKRNLFDRYYYPSLGNRK